jgi:hypothetical protein
MSKHLTAHALLTAIQALRKDDPSAALELLTGTCQKLLARPEARLLQAELVRELHGPTVAYALLVDLVASFPRYASARHLLGQVCRDRGDYVTMVQQYLVVHRLEAGLDEALEPSDAAALEEGMQRTAEAALAAHSTWQERLDRTPISWRSRPTVEQVKDGLDPRVLGSLEATAAVEGAATPDLANYRLVLYRTNLLASADDQPELCEKVHATVCKLLEAAA